MNEVVMVSSDEEDKKETFPQENSPLCTVERDIQRLNIHEDVEKLLKKFLDLCSSVDSKQRGGCPRQMKSINEKLFKRFKSADAEYTKSEDFQKLLTSSMNLVEKYPQHLFVHMKQVSDELKVRHINKPNKAEKRKVETDQEENATKRMKEDDDTNTSSENSVNERHVKKLERLFQKLYRKAKKLEVQEVNWDDDSASVYIRWQRYQHRLSVVWEKWQEVRGHLREVKRLKYSKIVFTGTDYPKLNDAISSFVNRTKVFPDFHDVLKITTDVLNQEEEEFTQEEIRKIAISTFEKIGNVLQKQRVYNSWNVIVSYVPDEADKEAVGIDPAEKDDHLAQKLEKNRSVGEENLTQVLKKYVEVQQSLKLEPKEVVNEDSKSEGEDDDEEEEEEEDDIIAISSSSERSASVAEENGEEENNGVHRKNKKDVEVKTEVLFDNGCENDCVTVGIDETSSDSSLTRRKIKVDPDKRNSNGKDRTESNDSDVIEISD